MTVRVTYKARGISRAVEKDFDADRWERTEDGELDLYRGKDLVGTIKAKSWEAVIVLAERSQRR